MEYKKVASQVVDAVGGLSNISAYDMCMTRLRLKMRHMTPINMDNLSQIPGVLGILKRGHHALEVVFGPGKCEAVYKEIAAMPELEHDKEIFHQVSTKQRDLSVRLSQGQARLQTSHLQELSGAHTLSHDKDDTQEVSRLVGMLGNKDADIDPLDDDFEEEALAPKGSRVMIINGPNINMLGIREPDIYGEDNYETLLEVCELAGQEAGFDEVNVLHSNHEGDLVDFIQQAYFAGYDGIIINPGAYTHTSIAIMDAAKATRLPLIEVHISKISTRESFRQVSYIRAAAIKTIAGMGILGYRQALFDMAAYLSGDDDIADEQED